MKFILLTVCIFCLSSITSAHKVFSVEYESQADVKVFVEQYESQAGNNDGKWFFTDYDSQAKKKIFFEQYESQADLKIFFVDYESQAGWNNNSKKALLY